MAEKRIVIYGAGISGMVAGYNLAVEGYDVTIREREEGYGGSMVFNPSTHTTPLDLEETSRYIGIDISPAFKPVSALSLYLHDFKIEVPVYMSYHVERSSRPCSIDTLLFDKCREVGVGFDFNAPLDSEELSSLPAGTIIACGLGPEAYRFLGVPHSMFYAWMARGEMERDNYAWMWLDECVNEYGYISFCNGIYFNLLFSYGREVGRDCLDRYVGFMERVEGMEEGEWEYISGAVPLAGPESPALEREGLIMCGTMSGLIDPLMGFGISGALISGKIAALAVADMQSAREEFSRFTRNFARVFNFKRDVWYPLRDRIDLLEGVARTLGPQRSLALLLHAMRAGRKNSAIPGFSPLSCH